MFYKALGYVVWQGGMRFVKWRYPNHLKAAGGGAALAGVLAGALIAVLLSKRDSE